MMAKHNYRILKELDYKNKIKFICRKAWLKFAYLVWYVYLTIKEILIFFHILLRSSLILP